MKSILVPVEDHDRTETILATALLFARIFGSRMTGFALAPATTPFLAADVVGASIIYEPLVEHNEERSAQARAHFHSFMGREKIAPAAESVEGPSWSWKDNVPAGDHMVGYLGRVYDITVVGRAGQQMSGPRALTLDAALFESGRPVLIAPPEKPESIGRRVVIAWNQSPETAHAVALALRVLAQADDVVVLTVEGSGVPGPSGEDLAAYLGINGIKARTMNVAPGSRSAGETILDEARALGCDLLIKGAYTQSRLRQIIFGGATRHILEKAEVPVFMAYS
jgi:nucleotide-binding universal stress UspA family protein